MNHDENRAISEDKAMFISDTNEHCFILEFTSVIFGFPLRQWQVDRQLRFQKLAVFFPG